MKAWFFIQRFVPRGSVVLAVTTLGSYVMGLLRDRILAQTFGASVALDSYNAAFFIPDFLFNLLVASGIAAAAVPLFAQVSRRSREEAHEYVSTLLSSATVVMLVTSLGVVLFAPWLAQLIVSGFEEEQQQLVVQLMRIVALSPILFAASNAVGSMLVAEKRFFMYGLSPILYNAGIIGGALALSPTFGVRGVAFGTLIGAALHLSVRVVAAIRLGWKPRFSTRWNTPEMKQTIRLMLPKMVGHPIELVTFGVFTKLASLLAPGSITVMNFARNFQSVPVSLLGIAMATAVFPSLAEAALSSREEMRSLLQRTAGTILLASIAAAGLMYAIRQPLITLLLGGGEFDAAAIARTAMVLGVFCLSIPTESLSHLFARAFYADQNTIVPVVWSVLGFIIASASAYTLIQPLGILSLPAGFFLGSFVKSLGLYVLFLRRVRRRVVLAI